MKVAPKVILLFNDADGFGTGVSAALRPSPKSNPQLKEDSFELSLERYGIKDRKASGNILHFHNADGFYEVSVVLLENYKPPHLVCALHEVLASLARDNLSSIQALVVPFIMEASKLKLDNNNSMANNKASVYSLQFGIRTDLVESLFPQMLKLSPMTRVYNEYLACLLQLLRIVELPAIILIGQCGRQISRKRSDEDLEIINEIGEKLGSFSSLCFQREKIVWNPEKRSIDIKEPWRALYG